METDPIPEVMPPTPAPAAPPDVEEVAFRPFRIFTRGAAPLMIIPMITAYLEHSGHGNFDGAYYFLTGTILAVVSLFIILPRWRTKAKGGIPPLVFEAETMEIPVSASLRRTRRVPYQDILYFGVFGKGRRGTILIQTRRRAFSYPARAFADDDAAGRLRDILRRRITASAGGAAQWQQMETRLALAGFLGTIRPKASWAMIGVIFAVFAAQEAVGGTGLFDYIVMGANAPGLVEKGEWYRLVTANLLHAGYLHLACNAFFGYIIAAMVERLLGVRRFVLLLLVTGILSQAVSAAWNLYSPAGHLLSVGISGALFGMLGALAVLNFRFAAQLPGGYRLTPRAWFYLLGLNFVAMPLLVHEIDVACHVGGFVSGIVMGWLLCRGQADITQPPPFGPASRLALALLSALWLAAAAQAVVNFYDPEARTGDRATVIHDVLSMSQPNPAADNELAWDIATAPSPGREELSSAQALATRARAAAAAKMKRAGADKDSSKDYSATTDTLATVEYRQGNLEDAIALEEPLFTEAPIFGGQLARFLNAYVQAQHKPRLIEAKEAPVLTLAAPADGGNRRFEIRLAEPTTRGAEIYALLMLGGKPVGIVNVSVWPNTDKASGVLLKAAFDEAAANAKEPGEFSLVLAQVDATGCRCIGEPDLSASYVPIEPDIAELP